MAGFDEERDFVVVGAGGGSMCAGLVLRQAGRDVLVLEKTELLGGSTAKAGGVMWIPANRFMARDGVADSAEAAATYLDNVVDAYPGEAPGTSRARRATYVREANAMLEFLIGQGIRLTRSPYWPDYYDERPGGSEAGRTVMAEVFNLNELGEWKALLRRNAYEMPLPLYEVMKLPLVRRSWKSRYFAAKLVWRNLTAKLMGKHWTTAGGALQGRMLQAAIRAGVELRVNAPVRELILEDGAVVGVETEREGKPWRVRARLGVLLNAGGFARNQAMRDAFIPHTRAEWTHTAPGDTGDMHRELMRIGAWMAQMNEFVGNQMMLPPGLDPSGVQMQLCKPHAFLVDQSGVRYMNEGGSYMAFCQNMLKRHETVPAVPSWMIMDGQFMKQYMFGATMPGSAKPRAWFDSGFLRKAPSLEALAADIGVDPHNLCATAERFNKGARHGVDEEFGRGERAYDRFLGDYTHGPNATLGTVEKAPFYAVQVVPGDVGTFGGAVTDCDARVLREDGSVIRGLYATGTTSAAVMGRTYPGAGCSIGPSFTWGFVAARHAARSGGSGA